MIIKKERGNYFKTYFLDEYLDGHNGFIAGGCFKDIFNNKKPKDVDVFFSDMTEWTRADSYFSDSEDYAFCYENDNVKCFTNKKTGIKVELCCKIFGTPEEIIKQFDFTITKMAYSREKTLDPFGEEEESTETYLTFDDMFFEHLHLQRLVIDDQINYPMSTFERILKYSKYGFFPCMETKIKICTAIHDLPIEQIEVSGNLYEGVD